MLSALLSFALLTIGSPPADPGVTFEDPVRLEAGQKPMGFGRLYPSPVLFDLDGDGRVEIVIGDLIGKITVCKSEAEGKWSESRPLLGADKKPLKFHNW